MNHLVYLGLGTNLGDRPANLAAARAGLAPDVSILKASPIYESPPWGYLNQPAFLNQVLLVETLLTPVDLLAYLKDLEVRLGRLPSVRYGPRQIDIDILFYDQLILEIAGLSIPHPQLAVRAFVLAPLADLAPDLVHPVLKVTIRELLDKVDRSGMTRFD
jgi:2-amino-4-hydroxy-6-hydroxymethyldihydropteridine diphosphokinase